MTNVKQELEQRLEQATTAFQESKELLESLEHEYRLILAQEAFENYEFEGNIVGQNTWQKDEDSDNTYYTLEFYEQLPDEEDATLSIFNVVFSGVEVTDTDIT